MLGLEEAPGIGVARPKPGAEPLGVMPMPGVLIGGGIDCGTDAGEYGGGDPAAIAISAACMPGSTTTVRLSRSSS